MIRDVIIFAAALAFFALIMVPPALSLWRWIAP